MTAMMKPFLFEGESLVRIVVHADEPWFVAADVCRVLGLSNPRKAVSALDDDEVAIHRLAFVGEGGTVTNSDGITVTKAGPPRGNPNVNIISESGLYALIFRSRKPAAKRFRKWVTTEVLPTIRRTGGYGKIPGAYGSMNLELVTAYLHDHQIRVLEFLRRSADSANGQNVVPYSEIAKAVGLSQEKVTRTLCLFVALGIVEPRPGQGLWFVDFSRSLP
ncbi:BRO family protein (plasmid) [Azospirillum sp. HJ39]|uniref:BRO family protein n=1 Tax=Azospirillum sp. HJ39 TaxID=3159496 RepID=UPI003558DF9E